MEKHGRKERQDRGRKGFSVKHFPMGDLIRDGAPLEDKSLAGGKVQRDLVVKNQAIGKDQPDRNKGKSTGRIVVFERKKQRFVPAIPELETGQREMGMKEKVKRSFAPEGAEPRRDGSLRKGNKNESPIRFGLCSAGGCGMKASWFLSLISCALCSSVAISFSGFFLNSQKILKPQYLVVKAFCSIARRDSFPGLILRLQPSDRPPGEINRIIEKVLPPAGCIPPRFDKAPKVAGPGPGRSLL